MIPEGILAHTFRSSRATVLMYASYLLLRSVANRSQLMFSALPTEGSRRMRQIFESR